MKEQVQYVGVVRDHSGSMTHYGLTTAAKNDYNGLLDTLDASSKQHGVETFITVMECGTGVGSNYTAYGDVRYRISEENTESSKIRRLVSYIARGTSTPLYDSVGELISRMKQIYIPKNVDVSYLVLVITDGHENASVKWSANTLSAEIKTLQGTDRWTFTFRVPRGGSSNITNKLSVHPNNVIEWDTTEKGMDESSQSTYVALDTFYRGRSAGITASQSFYTANMVDLKTQDVNKAMMNIASQIVEYPVDNNIAIKEFFEKRTNEKYRMGTAFYQLTKMEDVQDKKKILIRDKTTWKVFTGSDARTLLNLPQTGAFRLTPGSLGHYDVFIQSTSVNRKLIKGTQVMLWKNANSF